MALSGIDCDQVLKQLETYLDGELPQVACDEIELHLASCGSCLDHRDFRIALARVIREKCGPAEAPADLPGRIREALQGAG